jgi:UPF0716 family protein affecting phage T7 exclusion
MALDDYMEPEIAVTAAVTAVIFSPQVRGLLRKGLVYGLAGAMIAGDTITSFTRSIGQGVQAAQGEQQQPQAQQPENQTPPGEMGGQV